MVHLPASFPDDLPPSLHGAQSPKPGLRPFAVLLVRGAERGSHGTCAVAEGGCDCNHNCNRRAIWSESVVHEMVADRLVLWARCSANSLDSAGTKDPAPQ